MMTLATMADRSLPLAERVASALAAVARGIRSDEIASISELVADVAAADRLARADFEYTLAEVAYWDDSGDMSRWDLMNATLTAHTAALAAYRARMAQGVARG